MENLTYICTHQYHNIKPGMICTVTGVKGSEIGRVITLMCKGVETVEILDFVIPKFFELEGKPEFINIKKSSFRKLLSEVYESGARSVIPTGESVKVSEIQRNGNLHADMIISTLGRWL